MIRSQAEENYLKAIYNLSKSDQKGVSTKSIGDLLKITPPSVSDMMIKLSSKKLINYKKYQGVLLSKEGERIALKIIRKHRLWETFLVEIFGFKWDEVHDIAEQLEHIDSPELVKRLDKFLGFPKFDPHGDPIPNEDGEMLLRTTITLDEVGEGDTVVMVGVNDHSIEFLKHVDNIGVILGTKIKVVKIIDYDKSSLIEIDQGISKQLSFQVCKNIIVTTKEV